VSKLFSGDFNSLVFELTRLILANFVRRGTWQKGQHYGWFLLCCRMQTRSSDENSVLSVRPSNTWIV